MHPALLAMCTDQILHGSYTGQDDYGVPTYGHQAFRLGRLEFGLRRVVDRTGQERMSHTRLFLDGSIPVDLRDRFQLPDGTSPPILALSSPRDVDGSIDHHEIAL